MSGWRHHTTRAQIEARRQAFDSLTGSSGAGQEHVGGGELLKMEMFIGFVIKELKVDLDVAELQRVWVRMFGEEYLTKGVPFEEFSHGVDGEPFVKRILKQFDCYSAIWKQTVPGAASSGWIMWEGVNVTRYTHVDGQGGGRTLLGSWSDPFNSTSNTLCSSSSSAPAWQRCPAQCSASTARVSKKRVRKAVGTMPEDEWQRVVKALWTMRTLSEAEGQRLYGSGFRSMAYFNLRHYAGALPVSGVTDVTGGGAQTYTYHGLFSMELEST